MNPSYPPTDSHIPSLDHKRLLSSTWHVLDQVCVLPLPRSHLILILPQPPPPSLREILGAYKSKGDGDRDMLIAMLNAKSAEDQVGLIFLSPLTRPHSVQRMAAIASLHKTLLDLCTTEPNVSLVPPTRQYPLSSPHINTSKDIRHSTELPSAHDSAHRSVSSPRDPPHQPQPPRKRQRYSRSPVPSPHQDTRSSHPSSRDLPPSPYSSRSDSEEYSPRSRAPMAIGSLLSSGAGRDSVSDDPQNNPELSHARFPSSIGVSV